MKKTVLLGLFLWLVSGGCREGSGHRPALSGVGATSPETFYDIVLSNYLHETGNKVFYTKTSSGGGFRIFQDRVVDFVATNAFLTDKEMAEYQAEILHIPCTLGAVVLAYNLPNISELKLTSELIAGIYSGKISYWDDCAIAAVNPAVSLPHLLITPVFRSDESGITYLFSDYLCQTNPEWAQKAGKGKYFKLYTGIGIKGNPSVAGTIGNLAGSIGYLSMEHAALLNLPMAAIQNASGRFVKPEKETLQCIVLTAEFPDDMRVVLTNPPGENAYPIPCLSWILVYKNQAYNRRSIEKCESVKSFLNYVINPETQEVAGRLTHTPLPPIIIEKAQKLINSMTWNDER